eukprot:Rmarinus@m.13110
MTDVSPPPAKRHKSFEAEDSLPAADAGRSTGEIPNKNDSAQTGSITSKNAQLLSDFPETHGPTKVKEFRAGIPHPSGNLQRDKARKMFEDALAKVESGSATLAREVSIAVEESIWKKFSRSKEWKNKLRSVLFNLKDAKNPDFRARLMCQDIDPFTVADLTPEQMASCQKKEDYKKIREFKTAEAQMYNQPSSASTDQFKCFKCGKRECTYFQMQTRSADEPMTSFITCTNCGNRWRQ